MELNDRNIDLVCDAIYRMRADMSPTIELQDQLRQWLKRKGIPELLEALNKDRLQMYRQPEIKTLIKTV